VQVYCAEYCADESDGGYFDLKASTFTELRWLCSTGSCPHFQHLPAQAGVGRLGPPVFHPHPQGPAALPDVR
jgi:hypothetical protein